MKQWHCGYSRWVTGVIGYMYLRCRFARRWRWMANVIPPDCAADTDTPWYKVYIIYNICRLQYQRHVRRHPTRFKDNPIFPVDRGDCVVFHFHVITYVQQLLLTQKTEHAAAIFHPWWDSWRDSMEQQTILEHLNLVVTISQLGIWMGFCCMKSKCHLCVTLSAAILTK